MATDDILLRVLAETAQARREVDSLRANFEAALARMEEAAKRPDFDPLSAEARQLGAEVSRTGKEFREAFDKADREVRATENSLASARGGVRRLDNELERLGKAGGGVSGLVASLGELRAALAAVGGVAVAQRVGSGVGRFVGELAGEAQVARIQLDALRAQIDAAAGSSEAGGLAFEFARTKARELGFGLQDTIRAYAQFEAATRQTNLSTQQRREIFEATIEAGRVLQLSQQDINSALIALGQIAGKGKVSMEELRQQLGERLPGVLPILAKQLGITVAELDKMVSSGKLLADDALPALAKGLRETFGSGLVAALDQDAAALGRLRTQLQSLKVELGKGFSEETSAAIEGISEAAEGAVPVARSAGEAFADLVSHLLSIPASKAAEGIALLVTVLDFLGLRQQAVTGATQTLTLASDDLSAVYDEMIPKLKEEEELFRGVYKEVLTTAEAIEKAKKGDEEAAAQVAEIIRLAKERVPALKAAAAASAEATETEEKHKTAQEQVAEALARSAKEQEAFNQKLFESQGSLFKSREELDKLRIQIVNAVDSLVLLGAASVEQTDKALDFALKVAAGYREMGEAVPDDLVERIDSLAAASVDGAAKVTKALREEIDAFVALGEAVPPELLERFERLTKIMEGQEKAIALSTLGMKEFRESLFGAGTEIETRSEQLVKLVDSIGLLGPATVEQGAILREEIQEQLDAYAQLGERPPADLQRIAERFDVVTSRIEAQRKELQGLVEDFAGLADKIKASRAETGLAKDLSEQRAELEALRQKQAESGVLTLEEVERIGQLEASVGRLAGEVEGLGTNYDAFGDQASAAIEDVDDAIRDLIRENESALASLPLATQEAVQNILGGLQNAAVEGGATEAVIRDAMLKIADQLRIAGVETEGLTQALEDAAGGGLNLKEEFGRLGDSTETAAEAMARWKRETSEAAKEQETAADGATALGEAMKKAADVTVAETERMKAPLVEVRNLIAEIADNCERWRSCLAGVA